MSKMKMSEVFDLPVSVEGFNLNDGYIGGAGGMTISNFDCEFENTLSTSMAEHAAHAINNHDRLVEEIAELQAVLELMVLHFESNHNSEHECEVIKLSKKILPNLNQEGGE